MTDLIVQKCCGKKIIDLLLTRIIVVKLVLNIVLNYINGSTVTNVY